MLVSGQEVAMAGRGPREGGISEWGSNMEALVGSNLSSSFEHLRGLCKGHMELFLFYLRLLWDL